MSRSIVEYFRENEGSKCGYCKNEDSRYSHGMWGHIMTTHDYQDLIDRGWRRSGQYCYKPINSKCCCPMYTIRCAALSFRPSKSQKKTLRKFKSYIENGKEHGRLVSEADCIEAEKASPESVLADEISNLQQRLAPISELKVKLESPPNPEVQTEKKLRVSSPSSTTGSEPATVSQPINNSGSARMKGKLFRRERWRQRQLEKGMSVEVKTRDSEPKEVEDWLDYAKDGAHRFRTRLVPADPDDPEFAATFEESWSVYQKYQVAVHGDAPDKCSTSQYKRFLCKNPLIRDGPHGAFHRHYLIDDKIVAVGVIDVLTHCISSVYLYYDPDYSFLSLGTYTSLSEIAFVRELNLNLPQLRFYYLGFYIHSCQKMKYKGQFSPSFLCCPETYRWQAIESCRPLLDAKPYARLDPDADTIDNHKTNSLMDVKVLFCHQMMDWEVYKEVKGKVEETEVKEVEEYASLVGHNVASRMLLYRPN